MVLGAYGGFSNFAFMQVTGGNLNLTKSGTTQFHGSGAWYHRHEGLNANNWLNNLRGLPRPLFRFNDVDYTIGGPVYIPKSKILERKDKLFFFWSQEFQEQLRPQGVRRITVPTALERQGDFSQSVDSNGRPFPFIKDPLLVGQPCRSTNTAGCFKDGGVLGRIPQSRLYAPGIALLNLYPLPTVTGQNGFNFQSQISDSYPRREDLLRLDYNFSPKSRFWMHRIVNSNTFTSEYGSFVLGPNVPITPISVANPGYGYAFGNTYIFSPTLINEVTFGWTSNSFLIEPTTNAYTRAASGIHLPVLFPSAVQLDLIPNATFGGSRIANSPSIGGASCAACAPFRNYNTTIDLTDNLSKVSKRACTYIATGRIKAPSQITTGTTTSATMATIRWIPGLVSPMRLWGSSIASTRRPLILCPHIALGIWKGTFRIPGRLTGR